MGSAVLFYAIRPKAALLSDLNGSLVKTFQAVAESPREVFDAMHAHPRGADSYYKIRALYEHDLDRVECAARFIYLNRFCFNGLYRTNLNGRFNVPYASSGTGDLPDWDSFEESARLLAAAKFASGDFEEILLEHAKFGDFVYLDPPYAVESIRTFREYGPRPFGIDDLDRLASVLDVIDNRGAAFVLSYAKCAEAEERFARWYVREVRCQRNIAGFARHRKIASEFIFSNVEIAQTAGEI